jgi:prophage DNA circulation protein
MVTLQSSISSISSDLNAITSTVSEVGAFISGISGAFSGINPQWWQLELQPASFNGVPFWVKDVTTNLPKKVAVHQFAFSDQIYVEDLGAGTQTVEFDALLTGMTMYQLRDALVDAYNQDGVGLLVHPSVGSLPAVIQNLSIREAAGNVIELSMSFILTNNFTFAQLNQVVMSNTQSSVLTNALDLQGTMLGNFFNNVGSDIQSVEGGVESVVSAIEPVAQSLTMLASSAVRSVQSVIGIASVVPSTVTFGRFVGANALISPVLTGLSGLTSTAAIVASATSQLQQNAANASASAQNAISSMQNLAAQL